MEGKQNARRERLFHDSKKKQTDLPIGLHLEENAFDACSYQDQYRSLS
jgi:hypothetical protein